MKKINYIIISLIALMGCVFTSCKDDETTLSRAVLASVDILEYEALPVGPQIITVISDADWVSEAPEWVTISPASGHAGQTEVTISVSDNIRGDAPDNPRKATIQFKGRNLWSVASVIIRQGGDKFRDPVDYTIDAMEAAEEETVVRLPGMIVTAITADGFIATDGTDYVYVKEPAIPVTVGMKVSVVGEKFYDDLKMSYVLGERMTDDGVATVPAKTPVDITATLDKTDGKKYQYVTFAGDYDGSAVTVGDNVCKAYFVSPAAGLNVGQLGGHKVKVTGFFAGQAAPVVNIIPVEIEDLGLNEVVFFFDDFTWLEPWVAVGNGKGRCADQVGSASNGGNCPQMQSCIVDGVSAYDAMIDKGYDFIFAGHPTKCKVGEGPKQSTYLQDTYIKLGKTGYHPGLVLPALEGVSSGDDLLLTFDWCPMITGTGNFDKTQIVVIVKNGSEEVQVAVPPHTLVNKGAMEWQHASISLAGVKVDANSRIIIRNIDEQYPNDPDSDDPSLTRFFLDNIKVKLAD